MWRSSGRRQAKVNVGKRVNKQLLALHIEQARLQERIMQQRTALAAQLLPLQKASDTLTRISDAGQGVALFLRSHPLGVLAVLSVVLVLRPQASWRLASRGWLLWRGWRRARRLISEPALSQLFKFIWQRYANR